MDKIDWKIVGELERDGRQSYAELGERVGLSKSPCWSRVQQLEEQGIINGYAARIEPAALGLAVQSFVEVKINLDTHAKFEEAVMQHPAIMECHTTAGDSDYLLRVFARSVEHLDDLLRNELSKLPGVHGLATLICLKTIKRHGLVGDWASYGADMLAAPLIGYGKIRR